MLISSADLINLPVETQSGQHLGRVAAFDIDVDANTIIHYHVSTGLIKGLWHQRLLVHYSQVVSISSQKMVVEDNIKAEPLSSLKKVKLVVSPPNKI